MADGSTKVIYAALTGNVLVAVSKFIAAALSGSSAMLTEAVHSSADCVNQVLLLIGNRRSRAPADESHPFGYGAEIYFWASIVAVMVLIVGGVASVYEGVLQFRHPEPVRSFAVSVGVLALSALFEGASLLYSLREYRRIVAARPIPGQTIGLWRFIKMSKDPNLYESILEDSAALIGIGIATFGVVGNACLGWLWADGAASVLIGLLLCAVSWVIAEATRRLAAGEPVATPTRLILERTLDTSPAIRGYKELRTLQLGPRTILVTLTIQLPSSQSVDELRRSLGQLTEEIKAADSRCEYVFFRLDEAPN
ncbi:MAG: cation diffusion facilitator family transporter [Rhodospirillales bacterium]|nr:cation diffusion facilitator family transporter [Acetobacter sp.]